MGKAENEAKKEFLWSYRDSVRRLERISAEIEEIRAMRMGASAGTGGTGRRGWKNDLSAYAAQLDSLERKKKKELCSTRRALVQIEEAINDLKDELEKDILFYHYIKGKEWWEIAVEVHFSESWIYAVHGRALAHLKIPQECRSLE